MVGFQTIWILDNVACPGGTNDEAMFQAKLLANLANFTNDKELFCARVDKVCEDVECRCCVCLSVCPPYECPHSSLCVSVCLFSL